MIRQMAVALWMGFVIWPQAGQAQQVRQMLSDFRAEHGRGGLVASEALEVAAMAHLTDMSRNGFYDHAGSDGSSVLQRAQRAGYRACVIAENIAKGPRSLSQALGSWVHSAPHRKNMLLPQITEYGLAGAPGDYWVLVLAKPGC